MTRCRMRHLKTRGCGAILGSARLRCDSIRRQLAETRETACTSMHVRKRHIRQETIVERFPKLDVAGSQVPN